MCLLGRTCVEVEWDTSWKVKYPPMVFSLEKKGGHVTMFGSRRWSTRYSAVTLHWHVLSLSHSFLDLSLALRHLTLSSHGFQAHFGRHALITGRQYDILGSYFFLSISSPFWLLLCMSHHLVYLVCTLAPCFSHLPILGDSWLFPLYSFLTDLDRTPVGIFMCPVVGSQSNYSFSQVFQKPLELSWKLLVEVRILLVARLGEKR